MHAGVDKVICDALYRWSLSRDTRGGIWVGVLCGDTQATKQVACVLGSETDSKKVELMQERKAR